VTEPDDLKRAMFWEALARKPFLKTWLEQSDDETSIDTVQQQLESLAQPPEAQAPPDP
jgi:hypothetical protein